MIDMKLTYQTRDGRPVRILCVDGSDKKHPVIGILSNEISKWSEIGRIFPHEDKQYDLIEVKPKIVVERWVNILQLDTGIKVSMYLSEEIANLSLCYETQTGKILAEAVPFRWEEP